LLGFLLPGPLHGYELHLRIQDARKLGLVWRVKQANLYALLTKLEADGFLEAELIMQVARPPKRLFRLTEGGRQAFVAWVSTPVPHGRDVRIEFLAKLFWAQQTSVAATDHLLALQRDVAQGLLAQAAVEMTDADGAESYTRLVNEFRRGQLEAMLRWLDSCAATLLGERSDGSGGTRSVAQP
jgi:DNA-binding PadR family transcriptional regulator